MEKIQGENLFDIRITQEGLLSLNNSARMIKWLFRLAIVGVLFMLLNIFLLEFFYFKKQVVNTGSRISILSTIVFPIISVIDVVILLWQFYVFKQFGARCRKAIKESDELLFNQSFKFFYRYTVIACLQIIVILVLYLISIYSVLIMLSLAQPD
jgi:hypothetical protein